MGYLKKIDAKTVGSLLSSLFGKDCLARVEKVPANAEDGMVTRGRFVDNSGELIAVVLSDLPFAAFCGAAIAMLPPGGAEDAVDDNELTEMLVDAYGEVLNVLSRLFNLQDRPHCRYQSMDTAPLEAAPLEASLSARFSVEVQGYGTGRLTLLAA